MGFGVAHLHSKSGITISTTLAVSISNVRILCLRFRRHVDLMLGYSTIVILVTNGGPGISLQKSAIPVPVR